MLDNSRNISVRMTEEQHQRLERYMRMTRYRVTLYFRKLIRQERITARPLFKELNLHPGVNRIESNVRQVARSARAKALDPGAVAELEGVVGRLCEEAYLLAFLK